MLSHLGLSVLLRTAGRASLTGTGESDEAHIRQLGGLDSAWGGKRKGWGDQSLSTGVTVPLERGLGEHTEEQFISLGQKQGRKNTPREECRRPK